MQFNLKNSGVKRILQEMKELQEDTSKDYVCKPLEEDIFEWQFAIHGPKDSEFEGGIYHGRIILPPDYPFKPPAFMLLTPSGRFEVNIKICLSISQFHPEEWQPSWGVRTALVALTAFMTTKAEGVGSLERSKEERRALALKSRLLPPKYGSTARQRVIHEIHDTMLKNAPSIPEVILSSSPPLVQPAASISGDAPPRLSDTHPVVNKFPEISSEAHHAAAAIAGPNTVVASARKRARAAPVSSTDQYWNLVIAALVLAIIAVLIHKFYNGENSIQ